MNAEQILADELDKKLPELVAKYDALGMRASGAWAKELEVRSQGLKAGIWGLHYSEYLVNGRGPGKFPPIAAIEKWIEDKGITPVDISVSSLAFLIARKIAREGTQYFKEAPTDLISDVLTPAWIQSVIDKVSEFQISAFSSQVTNAFKQIAA